MRHYEGVRMEVMDKRKVSGIFWGKETRSSLAKSAHKMSFIDFKVNSHRPYISSLLLGPN
jgi:hypothetical protein